MSRLSVPAGAWEELRKEVRVAPPVRVPTLARFRMNPLNVSSRAGAVIPSREPRARSTLEPPARD
jgi:hypothetical protein